MRRVFELLVLIGIFLPILLFAWLNSQNVTTISLWPGEETERPVVFVVAAAFGIGVIITLLLVGLELLKRNIQLRQSQKKIRLLETERDELRNLPLREELQSSEPDPTTHPPLGDSGL